MVDAAARRGPGAVDAIVIGASAGAIEALNELLPRLCPSLDVPVIVVVHLPQRHQSLLPSLFAMRCGVPVCEPFDKQPVVAGTLWFAPADYHLLIDRERCFALSIDPPVLYSRPSLDVLFESAADVYGSRLAGVVLSGANEDGSQGASMIRKAGGQVLVQKPEEALATAMPEAAISAARPQFVGSLAQLVEHLRNLAGASP
jgi:two-component system chemotaxis response regulator CheB